MSEMRGGAEVRQPDELDIQRAFFGGAGIVFEFGVPLIYLTSKAFTPDEARRVRDDLTDAIAWWEAKERNR